MSDEEIELEDNALALAAGGSVSPSVGISYLTTNTYGQIPIPRLDPTTAKNAITMLSTSIGKRLHIER